MSKLTARLEELIPVWQDELKALSKEHGSDVVAEVTVAQVLGGMRGVRGLLCNTSLVPPDIGMTVRGMKVPELKQYLPEEVFYLLLTGELPDEEGRAEIRAEFCARAEVPQYVWDVLEAMPDDSHPMAMLTTSILVMQRESKFAAAYNDGVHKSEYWKSMLEDSLDLLARLPGIAAGIYRMRYGKGERIPTNPDIDWGADFAQMLGVSDSEEFTELMRLYMVLHCDHEGGNVSAFASQVVGSALSDLYYSLPAGLEGLAGPLHGKANQDCLKWVLEVMERFDGKVPTAEELEAFTWETLNSGKVIPGYGHAVLRVPDPRFVAFIEFGREHLSEDPVFQLVGRLFDVVPGVLAQVEKIKNPSPNVDAASGSLLHHFGITEFPYYTVLFSVSRAMGICAQSVLARAYGFPLIRPKSSTTEWLKEKVGA